MMLKIKSALLILVFFGIGAGCGSGAPATGGTTSGSAVQAPSKASGESDATFDNSRCAYRFEDLEVCASLNWEFHPNSQTPGVLAVHLRGFSKAVFSDQYEVWVRLRYLEGQKVLQPLMLQPKTDSTGRVMPGVWVSNQVPLELEGLWEIRFQIRVPGTSSVLADATEDYRVQRY